VFTAIAALILWYRLPVAPLHKSILLGYVPYLLFDAIFLEAFVQKGWDHDVIAYVNQSIYLLLVSHWAWVAWRIEVPSGSGGAGQRAEPEGPHTLARVVNG